MKYLFFLVLFINVYFSQSKSSKSVPLIIDGTKAEPGQFPWHAAIHGKGLWGLLKKYVCGGSLITQSHVLTAAHCITSILFNDYFAILGTTRLSDHTIKHSVKHYIAHEDYRRDGDPSDIGLLVLSNPVTISEFVQIIALPSLSLNVPKRTSLTVIGFGVTEISHESEYLLFATMETLDEETCSRQDPFPFYPEKQLCAVGSPSGGDCQGDSGGGLFLNENGEKTLVGIVSFGRGCDNDEKNPAYYVRVSGFLSWINETILDYEMN